MPSGGGLECDGQSDQAVFGAGAAVELERGGQVVVGQAGG